MTDSFLDQAPSTTQTMNSKTKVTMPIGKKRRAPFPKTRSQSSLTMKEHKKESGKSSRNTKITTTF